MNGHTYLLSLLSGVLSEAFLFSRGEWDRHAPRIVKISLLLTASSHLLFWKGFGLTFAASIQETSLHGVTVLAGIFGSMITYRLFFHRLRTFPGPLPARVSAFWVIKQNYPNLRFFIKLRELHDRYGDFVRIRPREISIRHPDAVADVHGPRNKIRKGEFYEQMYPGQSLQFTRDPAFHNKSRRYWDKAFQSKALNEYAPRLRKHYGVLMEVFTRHAASGELIDASKSFMFLGFDLVSELTFGESWNMLKTGKPTPIIAEFIQGKIVVGFSVLNSWTFHLLRALPLVEERMQYWLTVYDDALRARQEMSVESPDFFTHLSQADTFEHYRAHEAQLAIVAGSDTVAYTLSNILYLLSAYPQYQIQLYHEVEALPDEEGIIDDRLLMDKPCLLSIIKETLRLYPAVPSGVQRLTPPEGAVIAGRYVPGDTVISTPTYSIQRDERAFIKPDEFIPERWSSQPELILRKDAFFPFSYGAYSCAGRPMAMMELRMVIAMVVKRFRISFPPGKEKECRHFIEDQADCFVMHIHELPLLLHMRKSSE
ncbi:cytochrome P450 [Lentithecium fluviatile CBS 122367]|uniref:Cytochrome P450 n=1 Tax=Lentithecium fluviatile CBS 122367 TaxID=1168545 RepID=A0A6G1IZG7_9PLEO|nr:cytochrome P450 [Lentithecium fluviatile CBS 122367]